MIWICWDCDNIIDYIAFGPTLLIFWLLYGGLLFWLAHLISTFTKVEGAELFGLAFIVALFSGPLAFIKVIDAFDLGYFDRVMIRPSVISKAPPGYAKLGELVDKLADPKDLTLSDLEKTSRQVLGALQVVKTQTDIQVRDVAKRLEEAQIRESKVKEMLHKIESGQKIGKELIVEIREALGEADGVGTTDLVLLGISFVLGIVASLIASFLYAVIVRPSTGT